jgi:hypothetical protein
LLSRYDNGHSTGWDNTQISTSVHVEQQALAPPKVQTGITSIIYPLCNSSPEAIKLKPNLERQKTCNMIQFLDIQPASFQLCAINHGLILEVIKIFLNNETSFDYIDKSDSWLQPQSIQPPPKGHKTQEFMMHTTKIDEGSTEGNIEVAQEQYFDQLQHELNNQAIPTFPNQATNAHIWSGQILHKDYLNAIYQMVCFICGLGWFHVQLNLIWVLLHIHWGITNQIGSLQFFITLLGKVQLGKEKPDFNTLRSLATQVLAGNMLTYWKAATGQSLTEFEKSELDIPTLLKYTQDIVGDWASDKAARASADDDVKCNAVLLNWDFPIFFLLSSSISSGDFGRVELLMGTLTMMFAGAGSKNYTIELLHWEQNLKYAWTPELACVPCHYDKYLLMASSSTVMSCVTTLLSTCPVRRITIMV